MATSSITKQFEIKDEETYQKVLKLLEENEEPQKNQTENLKRGKELLKSFSFR